MKSDSHVRDEWEVAIIGRGISQLCHFELALEVEHLLFVACDERLRPIPSLVLAGQRERQSQFFVFPRCVVHEGEPVLRAGARWNDRSHSKFDIAHTIDKILGLRDLAQNFFQQLLWINIFVHNLLRIHNLIHVAALLPDGQWVH